uniref:Reverse transcriptase domain-containing protein n=1 Tax=Tanacetum cinerariifolium TaxID=118510 RepID=A0A6L2LYM0_TANCI|nr:reverse transcriptase domain-containing protein [Tanacetum cinerariifolium]
MRTRNSYFSNNSSVTIPRRRNKRRTPNVIEPDLRTIVEMADNRTMEELLQAPTEGYREAIVIPKINADHFEIKMNLLQLVQANMYHGFKRENPHTHINNFKRITLTLKFRDAPNDVIKLMMFPYSLREMLEFAAWERFKEMLRACPHHGFTELAQIDNFYNGLNDNDQDSLNATTGGNLLIKAVEESCVTCGGAYAYYNCLNTDSNQPSVCAAMGTYNQVAPQNRASNYMAPPCFASNQASTSSTLPSNTILNPKGEMKAITIRSGVSYEGPSIPTPKKATNQMEKFFQIFQDLHFDISFADALILMPKFASTVKRLLTNKDNFFELAKIPLNENCSAMLLKKLLEKLGDPGKFFIPCDFPGMDVCHALADLGASINLMPLSIWKKLSLPELTPTRMTLELADRSITRPKGVAKDVFVKEILLEDRCALVDVYGEEITLQVNDEAITFNLNQTTRYSSTYDDLSVNQIDIIGVAREEYAREILGFSNNFSGGNPTLTFEPILSDSSISLTSFQGSDFILEEIDAYLKDESISSEIDHADFKAKSSIEEPPDLELKDLPSHLEYAYLEGVDKLPVIITKDLKLDEKEALLKVLKSHKRVIAWKITDIKGIDPRLCTHKILMEEDYKLAVQSQRRVNPKIHEVEAKALPTNDARVVVKFLKSLFTRFGTPKSILSDHGTHFCNDKFAKVMSKMVGENRASWSETLDNALWAFRTAYKSPIRCTPYKLVYGKSCHLPIELEHKAYWALKHVNFDLKTMGDHQKLQLNELNELRDQAYENYLIYKEKTKKIHDSKINNRIFNVGDRVLLFKSRLKIFAGKLKTHWSGPFTITKVFPYGTVELSQPDGPNFKVNGHHVKHYFGGDVPQLVWILQISQEKSQKPDKNGHENGKSTCSLPSNTIPNPREDLKAITTRSGVTLAGPSVYPSSFSKEMPEVTKDTVQPTIKNIQPSVAQTRIPICVPVVTPKLKLTIPYPLRVNKQKLHEKDDNLALKFIETFRNLHFELSFADALLHIPKFALLFKSLLNNKEKLFDLAMTLVNENCSAVILKKLPEKLGDLDPRVPLILGRPFLRTGRALIDVYSEELTIRVDDEAITFKIPPRIDYTGLDLEGDIHLLKELLNNDPSLSLLLPKNLNVEEIKTVKSSIDEPPKLELKELPSHLEYAYLDGTDELPEIIAKDLKDNEKEALLKVLKSHKRANAWKISDIKGIDPRFCTHKILMEDKFKPMIQSQRLVNLKIHEVIKKEVIKLLNAEMIYPIFDSPWIARPMSHLLEKETPFLFFKDCIDAFKILKKKLTEAPILVVPDWNLPFELMCDASDFAIGAGLGQRKTKHFQPIHYASKTMTEAQIHYTTTEKEMLAVVYAFEKFQPYIVLSKNIVYTDHSALKYLLNKQDDKPRLIWTAYKTPIGCTPYKLVYGKSSHLPIKLEHKAYWALKHANFDLKTVGDHRKPQLNELNELRDQVHKISLIYKEKTKKLYDSKINNCIFSVSDRVLLFNSRLKIFLGKLKTRWSGPFTIALVFPYGTIELSQLDGPNFKVNGHRVKHYFGGDIP